MLLFLSAPKCAAVKLLIQNKVHAHRHSQIRKPKVHSIRKVIPVHITVDGHRVVPKPHEAVLAGVAAKPRKTCSNQFRKTLCFKPGGVGRRGS